MRVVLFSVLIILLCFAGSSTDRVKIIEDETKYIDSLCRDFIHPLKKYSVFDSLYARDFTDTLNGVTRHWYNGGDCYYHSTYKKNDDLILCLIIFANSEQRYYYRNSHLIKYVYSSDSGDVCISSWYGYHQEMYFKKNRLILRKDSVPHPEPWQTRSNILRESRNIYLYSRDFSSARSEGIGS